MKELRLLAREWRYSPATGSTGLANKSFGHVACPSCQPSPRLGVGPDRVDRAFRHADPAVDAFVRVDDEHVLALVEAVHGAHFDAVHDFAANIALVDDEGQLSVLSADRSGELIHGIRPSSRCSFIG